jgi:hypothetical protein
MENNEGFKSVAGKIKELEHQLSLCDEVSKELEQNGEQAEREIEEHFWMCEHALAARKAALLNECAQKIKDKSNYSPYSHSSLKFIYPGIKNETAQQQLRDTIEACKRARESGAYMFQISIKVAELTWKVFDFLKKIHHH